jgi:uncharacterized protein
MPKNTHAHIQVTVKPKSSRREVKVAGNCLIVAVTAPPAEGKANEMVIELVADWLGVPKSRLALVSGLHHKEKVIAVEGVTEQKLAKKLTSGKMKDDL